MTLGTGNIIAFAATANAEAARSFYGDTLGLKLVSDDQFALVFDANGTTLRIARVEAVRPAQYTVLGWHVDDIAATVQTLAARGVQFERYLGMDQDELAVWSPPGGGKVAWFKDPDGNLLSLSQG